MIQLIHMLPRPQEPRPLLPCGREAAAPRTAMEAMPAALSRRDATAFASASGADVGLRPSRHAPQATRRLSFDAPPSATACASGAGAGLRGPRDAPEAKRAAKPGARAQNND